MPTPVEDPFEVDVTYTFDFKNGETRSFEVKAQLDQDHVKNYGTSIPEWTNLELHKCAGCPLHQTEHPQCPAALAIADIIEFFSQTQSFNLCDCHVTLPNKEVIVRDKPVQDALYPLIGLRLATSRCPKMAHFRPLSRFHEPFAGTYYTVFRATSYYLLSQHLRNKKNDTSDLKIDFRELQSFYEEIGSINRQLVKRLEDTNIKDATPNSIFVLSLFGLSMTMLFEDYLKVIESLCALGWEPKA